GKGEQMLWAVGNNAMSFIGHESGGPPCHALVLLEPGEREERLVKDAALERTQERKGRVIGPDGEPLTSVTVTGLWSSRWYVVETLKGAEFTVRGINPRAPRQLTFYHKDKNLGFFLKELPGEKA